MSMSMLVLYQRYSSRLGEAPPSSTEPSSIFGQTPNLYRPTTKYSSSSFHIRWLPSSDPSRSKQRKPFTLVEIIFDLRRRRDKRMISCLPLPRVISISELLYGFAGIRPWKIYRVPRSMLISHRPQTLGASAGGAGDRFLYFPMSTKAES